MEGGVAYGPKLSPLSWHVLREAYRSSTYRTCLNLRGGTVTAGKSSTGQTLACYLAIKGTGAPFREEAGKAQPQACGRVLHLVFTARIVGMARKSSTKRPWKGIWSPKETILMILLTPSTFTQSHCTSMR